MKILLQEYTQPSYPILIISQEFRESLTPRDSFLDPIIVLPENQILRASALFNVDDSDGILRRWRLFESLGTTPDQMFPSIELLAYALTHAHEKSPREIMNQLRSDLTHLGEGQSIQIGERLIHPSINQLEQRII